MRYTSLVAIRSFADPAVERFFRDGRLGPRTPWAQVSNVVARKLDMLDYAVVIADLASPPGNRLEALKGNLAGWHSIRVNERWRVVFQWTPTGPAGVDVVDYH